MPQDIEQVEYVSGMLEKGMEPGDLPGRVWSGAEIPADVVEAIRKEDLFSLGGVHGDKHAGDPAETIS